MRPSLSHPILVLALLAGAATASAQQAKPSVVPLAPQAKAAPPSAHAAHAGAPNLPPAAGGKALIEAPSFDAGRIERGEKITHSFIVKNTGTGVLALHAKPG